MTTLRHYADATDPTKFVEYTNPADIARVAATVGIRYERWPANGAVRSGDAPDRILAAYSAQIEALKSERGFATADVVTMVPDHPKKDEFRKKFLDEHTHSEDEVRFFVDGAGLFTIHADSGVYAFTCEADDLISVPAGTKHWFDMGPSPRFTCIRLFTDQAGWVANYTGDDIATKFPRFDAAKKAAAVDDDDAVTVIGAKPRIAAPSK